MALVLGGCMSENDDANDPLPVMSRPGAQKWARHFVDSMARTADTQIDPTSVRPDFTVCVGKDDEVVDDGRFVLDFSARAPLATAGQAKATQAIRGELEKRGYEIVSYQEAPGKDPGVTLEAWNAENHFAISVEGYRRHDGELLLTITTPCLLPPGVTQQKA
ncbi:hypothetical protein ACZ90_06905 [Streptomyces albus subsp. albus]|nr:hypothetical protein ACZ90_06905 [Streptomyces albus subsp. albus]